MKELTFVVPPNPICAACNFWQPLNISLKGGLNLEAEVLICDDCGKEIENGECYFNLNLPTYENVCEDCVMQHERTAGAETPIG